MACDRFTVETVRLKTPYVLFFIELGSRRIWLGGVTAHPDGPWMAQQAREYSMATEVTPRRFLIHDRDSKFSGPFDEVFEVDGVEMILTPVERQRVRGRMGKGGARGMFGLDAYRRSTPSNSGSTYLHRALHPGETKPRSRPSSTLDPVKGRNRPETKPSSISRRDRLGGGLLHEYYL